MLEAKPRPVSRTRFKCNLRSTGTAGDSPGRVLSHVATKPAQPYMAVSMPPHDSTQLSQGPRCGAVS